MQRASGIFRPQASSRLKKGKSKMQSCTLKLYCLSDIDDDKPPGTIANKTALSSCGLGPGSITLDINTPSVHEALLDKFPLLQAAGGYELLLYQRGGEEQGFHKLPTPYSPARLKEVAGQAQIYIRPLQKNLLELDDSNKDQPGDQPGQHLEVR